MANVTIIFLPYSHLDILRYYLPTLTETLFGSYRYSSMLYKFVAEWTRRWHNLFKNVKYMPNFLLNENLC